MDQSSHGGHVPSLSWSSAPEEIVVQVFLHLSPAERGLARQVCKRWDIASSHPAVLRNSVLKLVGSFGGLSLKYLTWNERIRHLHVVNVDNSQWGMQLSGLREGDGHYMRQLVLENCPITFATFLSIVQIFSQLESLTINGCNTLFMTGQLTSSDEHLMSTLTCNWSRMRTVEVVNVSYLNDDNFSALFNTAGVSTLGRISLRSIKLAYHLENMTKGSLLCFSSLKNFITNRRELLTDLTLDFSNVTDTMLVDLSQIDSLNLLRLSLFACRDVTDKGVIQLVKTQTALEKINISQLKEITAKVLVTLEENCKHLSILLMSKCNSVVGRKSVPSLNSLPITHLNLSECHRIDSKDLLDLCATPPGLPHLETLEIENFGVISDQIFPLLCTFSPKLQTLNMCTVPSINIESMVSIYTYLTELRVLKIAWTNSITDDLLLGANNNGEGGDQVDSDVIKCSCDFTLGLQKQQEKGAYSCPLYNTTNISRLTKLEQLDLFSCSNISDLSIIHTFRLPNLKQLNLSMCTHITDASVEVLCMHCKSIERLNLSYTPVTDDGVKLISKYLKILRALILTNCMAITDSAVGYLEAYAYQLTELDVSLCPGITIEQINHFQHNVTTVHSIKSRFISSGNFLDTD
ncbi:F-box and leucine-rich repeat protein 13-like [Symsagittifera roscoffensis]|uniref:F-box and leucine-rich repeat protein 13-like n=1 Tax=Symsagittifera roscoffensis TaxID=84072 RepID=UPI00307B464D